MNLIQRIKAFINDNPQKVLLGSAATLLGRDVKRPDFSHAAAVANCRSWVYAAARLNAIAVASAPLRLYVRKRGGAKALWNTRRTGRRTKAYLSGDLSQLPSRYAMTKAAEFGDDYEIVTDSHPVLELLSKVNPYQNGFDATVLRVLYTELTGNAYLHPLLSNTTNVPVQLWTLPSQYVEIVPGDPARGEEFVRAYRYGATEPQKVDFAPEEIIHFKLPNPGDMYYGLGKVEAAWGAVTSNVALHEMDYHFFKNKSRPDYLVVAKGNASEEELDRFTAEVENKLRGTNKTGRFLAVTGDLDLKPLQFPPKDLQGREEVVEEIAAVFGVPVSMLRANDPNLASATVGFATWKETTVLPLLRMDEEVLNQSLLPLFDIGDDAFLAYDNPVRADEAQETSKRLSYVQGGILTANEAREMEGLEPSDDPNADRLLINGQPLGGAPAPAASPFGGLFGASAGSPVLRPDSDYVPSVPSEIPEVEPKSIESQVSNATRRTKDALGDCVSDKIPKLMDEGYEQDQAVAIAYSMCSGKGLEESIGKAVSDIDTKPPASVAANAQRALDVRETKPESERGMTEVGIARARDLSNRVSLSEDTIRRMVAYFDRHQSDKQGSTWDEQGKGWQAWNGWGGDEGWAWAKRKVEEFDAARDKKSCGCGCGCNDDDELLSDGEAWSKALANLDFEEEVIGAKNCGIGSGGFEEGNQCASGGSGGNSSRGESKPSSDKPKNPSKPKQPKPSAKPPKGAAPKEGMNKPKEHNVKLPADPKRLNIDEANLALRQMGYTQGKLELRNGAAYFDVTDSSGNAAKLQAREITNLIYANSSDPKDNARPALKPRKSFKQSEFVGAHAPDFGAWLRVKSAEKEAEKIGKAEDDAARKVSQVFDKQVKDLLAALAAVERPTQDLIAQAERIIRTRSNQRAIVDALAPYIREALSTGIDIGMDTVSKVATNVDFEVERRDLAAYAETESIRLSRQTASGVVETQTVRVREVLGQGLEQGDTVKELATRVQDWADGQKDEDGSWSRARTIARTEAMRAARTAEVEAWQSTGLVTGKTWLLAPDPCEFCEAASKAFGDKSIGLGDTFYKKGDTITGADGGKMLLDYEDVQGPPLHPNCRCSMQPQLIPELEEINREITESGGIERARARINAEDAARRAASGGTT